MEEIVRNSPVRPPYYYSVVIVISERLSHHYLFAQELKDFKLYKACVDQDGLIYH